MADAMYPLGANAILNKEMDFDTDNFRAVLIDTGVYTYSAAHEDHADLSGIVATSGNMTMSAIASGAVDATDLTFAAVTGNTVEALVFYHWTGTSSTSKLILFLDSLSEFPFIPNGSNVTIVWHASGIFDIV